ncbi:hypothetical protein ABIB50_000353 [Mucilaginibacter sp. UYCu711]
MPWHVEKLQAMVIIQGYAKIFFAQGIVSKKQF